MNKYFYASLLVAAYAVAYLDWLQPGYLRFGVPAAWDKPLTTATTYDLGAGVRNTAKCAALETVPDWAKPANWRLPFSGPRTEEPKTCTQQLREQEAK